MLLVGQCDDDDDDSQLCIKCESDKNGASSGDDGGSMRLVAARASGRTNATDFATCCERSTD